ncbi:hypothetical protein EI74_0269 [Mycoplasma testudineum]|uniref:Uncharacterized protein n=1 Tax=Mycoplasma testudineum TaxID=244584 RepID=A0A4R6IEH9_9MOLU|nr:hypothetical protein [Mycoplasma testudineum]OYD26894.1 hypothetical protein CG473_00960 [Mycoplasma testudineum]TDO20442.1 hypothetical protein EI74_0269 [Mycoplasma testudineum]
MKIIKAKQISKSFRIQHLLTKNDELNLYVVSNTGSAYGVSFRNPEVVDVEKVEFWIPYDELI